MMNNLKTGSCSSGRCRGGNNTTTTTTESSKKITLVDLPLQVNQTEIINRYSQNVLNQFKPHFAKLTLDEQIMVLDEFEGRLRDVKNGAEPVRRAVPYIETLCNSVRLNEFEYEVGERIARERERKARQEAIRVANRLASEDALDLVNASFDNPLVKRVQEMRQRAIAKKD